MLVERSMAFLDWLPFKQTKPNYHQQKKPLNKMSRNNSVTFQTDSNTFSVTT